MRAAIFRNYGPPEVLRIEEVQRPVPRDDEILVRIFATTVSAGDWRTRKADPFAVRLYAGLLRPKRRILGSALSGRIVEAGKGVTQFAPGEEVFASTGMGLGAHAELASLPAGGTVTAKPAGLSHEAAAAIPFGALTALFFLKEKAEITEGKKVLIYGASGEVGGWATQLARHFGAEVTGVCGPTNVGMVRSLGAAQVIDYTKEDFTERGGPYDIIFDAVGKASASRSRRALAPGGKYVSVASGLASPRKEDLLLLKQLVEEGRLRPIIDREYPFEQIAEAHRYAETGHKKGSVVIALAHAGDN